MPFSRAGLRLAQQIRSPALRSTLQRRLESTASPSNKLPMPGMKLEGAMDNAFNRERAAVKAHAQATSGKPTPPLPFSPPLSSGPRESSFLESECD